MLLMMMTTLVMEMRMQVIGGVDDAGCRPPTTLLT